MSSLSDEVEEFIFEIMELDGFNLIKNKAQEILNNFKANDVIEIKFYEELLKICKRIGLVANICSNLKTKASTIKVKLETNHNNCILKCKQNTQNVNCIKMYSNKHLISQKINTNNVNNVNNVNTNIIAQSTPKSPKCKKNYGLPIVIQIIDFILNDNENIPQNYNDTLNYLIKNNNDFNRTSLSLNRLVFDGKKNIQKCFLMRTKDKNNEDVYFVNSCGIQHYTNFINGTRTRTRTRTRTARINNTSNYQRKQSTNVIVTEKSMLDTLKHIGSFEYSKERLSTIFGKYPKKITKILTDKGKFKRGVKYIDGKRQPYYILQNM